MTMQYPTEFPTNQIRTIVEIMRSGKPAERRNEALHAAVHIGCYAVFMTAGQPQTDPNVLVTRSMADPDDEQNAAIDELASVVAPADSSARAFLAAGPGGRWMLLLQLALKVLPMFL